MPKKTRKKAVQGASTAKKAGAAKRPTKPAEAVAVTRLQKAKAVAMVHQALFGVKRSLDAKGHVIPIASDFAVVDDPELTKAGEAAMNARLKFLNIIEAKTGK